MHMGFQHKRGSAAMVMALDGSAAAPSITLASEPTTGFYKFAPGVIGVSLGGTYKIGLSGTYIYATTGYTAFGPSCIIRGNAGDGATAVSVVSNTPVVYATAGSKINSFQNNSVEKAFVDNNGLWGVIAGNTQTTVGAAGGASGLPATPTGYFKISVAGTEYVVPYYAVS